MWLPNIPKVKGIEYAEGYETVSTEADRFEGQSVLILGQYGLHLCLFCPHIGTHATRHKPHRFCFS